MWAVAGRHTHPQIVEEGIQTGAFDFWVGLSIELDIKKGVRVMNAIGRLNEEVNERIDTGLPHRHLILQVVLRIE
jgi:hypothetical protein